LAEDAVVFARQRGAQSEQDAALLAPFDLLLASAVVPSDEKVYVRHHRAKALKRLDRHLDALNELEEIVRERSSVAPAVTRLLLARILTELPPGVTVAGAQARARELLLGLLDEAKAGSPHVSATVTLAAAELLRRGAVAIDVAATLPRYADVLEPLIVGATRRGLMQGPFTFGALAKSWRDVDGDAFWRVFEALPLPSVPGKEELEPEERNAMTAWGEILVAAAEHEPRRRVEFLEAALAFFTASTQPYGHTHAADTLTRLGRPAEAVAAMRALLAEKLSKNDKAWAYRRMAEAQKELGDFGEAEAAARLAYASLPPMSRYRDDFMRYIDELRSMS
jgi:tetratricopeptide (TPR) repeat protein